MMRLDNMLICNKNYTLFITNYIEFITIALIIVSIMMIYKARGANKRVADCCKNTNLTARTRGARLFLSDKLTRFYYCASILLRPRYWPFQTNESAPVNPKTTVLPML